MKGLWGVYTSSGTDFNVGIYSDYSIVTNEYIVSGGVSSWSDIRIKKNIQPKTGILHFLEQVNFYSYDHIDERKGHVEFGVIAQEIKEILPSCVRAGTEYLPNVYKIASFQEELQDRVRIYVANSIKAGDKVKVFLEKNGREITHISIVLLACSEFIDIEKWSDYTSLDEVFVYGTEDAEVLSVEKVELGMAALGGVKELSMLVKEQQLALVEQQQMIQSQQRALVEQQQTISSLTDRLSRVESLLSHLVS